MATSLKQRLKRFKSIVTDTKKLAKIGSVAGAGLLLASTLTGCNSHQETLQADLTGTGTVVFEDPEFIAQIEEDIKQRDEELGIGSSSLSDTQLLMAEIKALQQRISELEGKISPDKYSQLAQISTSIENANVSGNISQNELIDAINRLTEEVSKQTNTIIIENNPTFNNTNNPTFNNTNTNNSTPSNNAGATSADIQALQQAVMGLAQDITQIKEHINNSQIEEQLIEVMTLVKDLQNGYATKEDVDNAVSHLKQSISNSELSTTESLNKKLDEILSELHKQPSSEEQGGQIQAPSTGIHPLDGVQELQGDETSMKNKILINLATIKMDVQSGARTDLDKVFVQLTEVEDLVVTLNFNEENSNIVNKSLDDLMMTIIEVQLNDSYSKIAGNTGYSFVKQESSYDGSYHVHTEALSHDSRGLSYTKSDYKSGENYFYESVGVQDVNGGKLASKQAENDEFKVYDSNACNSTNMDAVGYMTQFVTEFKDMRNEGEITDIDFSSDISNGYKFQFVYDDCDYDMTCNKDGNITAKGQWDEVDEHGNKKQIDATALITLGSLTQEQFDTAYNQNMQFIEDCLAKYEQNTPQQ